jgi:23S rRNA pseudoU1915 N3-methylase RlmH
LVSCRRYAPEETGGILVGYSTDALNCAVVTAAEPSPTDTEQIARIMHSASYKCPEPVLLLVGGPAGHRSFVRVYVFVGKERRDAPIELLAT